jgi:hypothetical protein
MQIKGDGRSLKVSSADYDIGFLGALGSGGTSVDKGYFYLKNAGTTKIQLHSDGDSYFNGGNVGIGTTSPAYKLDVWDTGGGNIASFTNGVNADLRINCTSGVTLLTPSTGTLAFGTSSTERMRIDASGVILRGTTTRTIGTLGDVNALGISGNSGSANPMVVFAETDSTVEASSCILELAYSADTSFSSAFYTLFADSGGTQGTISGTGAGTVSYNTSSDERIKENIVDTGSQLETIKQIQVKDFNYIGKNTTTTGMIAQELNAIIPNVVVEGGDDATKHPWGIDYGKLTPYLIKAIQEQQTQIEALQSEINLLKGE